MGVSANISHGSNVYTLSLVKWSIMRKVSAKIFKTSPFRFTPVYELAIYEKQNMDIEDKSSPTKQVGGSFLDLDNPCFVFHFADKKIATTRMNWAKELIESGGMRSLIENLRNFDPKREGIYSDLTDYFERRGLF